MNDARIARWMVVAVLGVVCCGCGGGVSDPFQRVRVHGTATVGGTPVAHGILRLTGEKLNDNTVANVVLKVAEGKFDSEAEGFPGITAGECNAELHLYKDSDGSEPLGTWTGIVSVPADGAEIKLEIPSDAVEKAPPNT